MDGLFTDSSRWCRHPEIMPGRPCFALFRKTFKAAGRGCRLRLNVSADNRYNLFLDGERIGRGPCRSDLKHYNYETYDIELSPGRHALCTEVAVFGVGCRGKEVALAEMHSTLGFLAAGGVFRNGKKVVPLDTPQGWKCAEDFSRTNRPLDADVNLRTFAVVPPMEKVDVSKSSPNWKKPLFDGSGWPEPADSGPALLRGYMADPYTQWWLVPRQIPTMEEKICTFADVIKAEGVELCAARKMLGKGIKIESGAKITLDAGALTTAFPQLRFEGGSGASVRIAYSESLFQDGKKLVRDDVKGAVFGYSDLIELDGSAFTFEPFWFRTFRFVELEVRNPEKSPIKIFPPAFRSFMYPFKMRAAFDNGDREIRRIWDVAWRTARLCAHEHYYDCPYYEQLQYVGDTRIQALISYALTGDGRLGRQAILHFDWSRLPEGITHSRYPTSWPQVIPGFSLYWVMMVKDHYDYFGDKELVREVFPGVMAVLDWFERHRIGNGLIGHLPYWNFTDWLPEWPNGNPSRQTKTPLTINSLQYAEACACAAYLAGEIGDGAGRNLAARRKKTLGAVDKLCVDRKSGLYLDMPGRKYSSQHVNVWAIISGAVAGRKAREIGVKIQNDAAISKTSLYFSFYLMRAWEKIGLYGLFWKKLEDWKSVLKWNFTTFPEIPATHTRSDCHAWSASPLFEFVSRVLGVRPGSPGFATLLVQPECSATKKAAGKAPCGKNQTAEVAWEISGDNVMSIRLKLTKPKETTIVWPDGKPQRLGRIKSGEFRRKI